ncbi:MAG: carbohydrate kinase [Chloroflexota bacterium]|nr:carbohydrate kinase [Chloroflexota bacterium]
MTNPPATPPVLCIGEILIDLIADPGESLTTAATFAIREGGAPMNAAIAMARLGLPSRFCGAVGDDQFGERLRALLDREGVDASSLRTIDGEGTSIAYAWRDERGDGHFQLVRLADRLLRPSDVAAANVEGAGAMLVGSVALAAAPSRDAISRAVEIATKAGVPVIFDVNVRPTLWPGQASLLAACEPILEACRVLKLSLDDARQLWDVETTAEALEHTRGYGPWLTVITDGSRGVAVQGAGAEGHREFPVISVKAVDPTGAGDAFTAALITRLVQSGWKTPTDADIRFAMAAGALATTRQGALTALPTLAELERFLAEEA